MTHERLTATSLGQLSKEEEELLAACLPDLKKNIEKGKKFVSQS